MPRAKAARGFSFSVRGEAGARPSRETEHTFRWRAFFVWGARRAKYPRRPRRVALWGDLGGVQFRVTEVNREGRAPARPRALSIAASKLFRIIISEAIVTEVGEISLRKTEMVGWVQAGRTVNSWKDEKRWGGFSAPRAEGGAGTSRAGPVWSERLWGGVVDSSVSSLALARRALRAIH